MTHAMQQPAAMWLFRTRHTAGSTDITVTCVATCGWQLQLLTSDVPCAVLLQPSDTARVARLRKQHIGPNHALMYAVPLHIVRGEVRMRTSRHESRLSAYGARNFLKHGMLTLSLTENYLRRRVQHCGQQMALRTLTASTMLHTLGTATSRSVYALDTSCDPDKGQTQRSSASSSASWCTCRFAQQWPSRCSSSIQTHATCTIPSPPLLSS